MCRGLKIKLGSPHQLIEKGVDIWNAARDYSNYMAMMASSREKAERWKRVGMLPFLGFRRTEPSDALKTAGEVVHDGDSKPIQLLIPITGFSEWDQQGTKKVLREVKLESVQKAVFQLRKINGKGLGWVLLTKQGTHNWGHNRAPFTVAA